LEELLCKISQPAEWLPQLDGLGAENRKKEWLCVRLMLQIFRPDFLPHIAYDHHHRPFLPEKDFHISISHSSDKVAVFMHPQKKIGIDLEYIHPRILKVLSRFLHSQEQAQVLKQKDPVTAAIICWSAKETLYKYYGQKEPEFKENIRLYLPEYFATKGGINARIKGVKNDELEVEYRVLKTWVLTYTMESMPL